MQWQHHRARVAALSRDRAPDDPELLEARRALAEARVAERQQIEGERITRRILQLLDSAPDWDDERREQIAALLRGGATE